jgi:hypothetical protein
MRIGKTFETEFFGTLAVAINKNGVDSIVSTIDSDLDKFFGTDAIFDDIRIDFTSDFSNKDHMKFVSKNSIKTRFGNIMFGVRTGNNVAEFDEPVVVVGIDMFAGAMRTNMDAFFEAVQKNATEIMDNIVNVFFDFLDSQEQEVVLA